MKASALILGVSVLISLLITGCATTSATSTPETGRARYVVEIDSIAAAGADLRSKTYVLSSAMKNVGEHDLQFREFAGYIETALSKQGYKRVDSEENADLLIRLAYGIGDPKTEIYTQTYTTSTGYSYPVGWTWITVPPKTETVTVKKTTYSRYLILEAYDSRDRRSQLWKTTVTSTGRVSDLRIALPHMVVASIPYFGTNTGEKIETFVYSGAPEVIAMKSPPTRSLPSAGKTPDAFSKKDLLGVTVSPLTNKLASSSGLEGGNGVLVVEVSGNSPAQEMGLIKGDVILAVNNKAISGPQVLVEEIQNTEPGGEILLLIYRDGKKMYKVGSLK